jgi:hypothetical protein
MRGGLLLFDNVHERMEVPDKTSVGSKVRSLHLFQEPGIAQPDSVPDLDVAGFAAYPPKPILLPHHGPMIDFEPLDVAPGCIVQVNDPVSSHRKVEGGRNVP